MASCRAHYARLRNRNKWLAQNRCHAKKHISHEKREDCCIVRDCLNYHGKWT